MRLKLLEKASWIQLNVWFPKPRLMGRYPKKNFRWFFVSWTDIMIWKIKHTLISPVWVSKKKEDNRRRKIPSTGANQKKKKKKKRHIIMFSEFIFENDPPQNIKKVLLYLSRLLKHSIIKNQIIWVTLVSWVVLTWFQCKEPKIKRRVEISITIYDFSFQCSGAQTSPLLRRDNLTVFGWYHSCIWDCVDFVNLKSALFHLFKDEIVV